MAHHTSDHPCLSCEEKLGLAHPDLQKWFREHVKPNFSNAHVSWSYRDQQDQEQAFSDGKSRLHFPHSDHNKTPARALDLFEILESGEGAWNPAFFASVNQYNEDHGIVLKWGALYRLLGDSDHWGLPEDT